ncbi:hypothetical protein [Ruminococcus sp. 5_1_39BFAA]|uniref:hypothetical protein n=1 Tax=Ruminococcus sp. 5_1_39BFAA TaxID=457412 RepID=UPI0035660D27
MNANAELLNYVYQNSQMGVDTLQQIIGMTDDNALKAYLEKQLEGYEKFHSEARKLLNQNGFDEKGLNTFEKIRTYLMVNMQTMTDTTSSHIAKMLIQGSSMGVTEAIKNIRQYEKDVEKNVRKLMEDLKDYEEKNIEKLKEFL